MILPTFKPRARHLKFVLWNIFWVLLALVGLETSLGYLLSHPPDSGDLLEPMREYYVASDRKIVQFLPQCAQWDEFLGYTLKPGLCRFANREFDTGIFINSAGVRDDEESLHSPEILVLGDSHAMGWGVEDDEVFSRIVEGCGGRRVLNAAVSSYGTVRELSILSRLDTSNIRWLILQYCPNDIGENRAYSRGGQGIKTMTGERYVELVAENNKSTGYYPGKHTARLLPLLARSSFGLQPDNQGIPRVEAQDSRSEAAWFLEVLQSDWNLPTDFRLIVFEVDKLAENDSVFVDALQAEILESEYPRFIEEMTIVDMSEDLQRSDYFAYDGHMSAKGHRVIARKICGLIETGIDEAGSGTEPSAQ